MAAVPTLKMAIFLAPWIQVSYRGDTGG